MKNFTFLFILSFCLAICNAQNPIPNSGFESWSGSGNSAIPQNWSKLSVSAGPITIPISKVERSTDSYAGTYAAKVVTAPFDDLYKILLQALGIDTDIVIPSILSLGKIDALKMITLLNLENPNIEEIFNELINDVGSFISGGAKIQKNISEITGYYKYTIPTDTAFDLGAIFVLTSKFDLDSNKRVIVGMGTSLDIFPTDIYSEFSVPIVPLNEMVADTVNIFIFSSLNFLAPVIGASFFVDELTAVYVPDDDGINENEIEVLCYPNPNAGKFTVQLINSGANINIFDLTGRLVETKYNCAEVTHFELLRAGTYFVEVLIDNKKNIKKVVIY